MNSQENKSLSISTLSYNLIENQSLPGAISQIAHQYPGNIAIEVTSKKMSYRSLDELSERVANYLIIKCGSQIQPIAILTQDPFAFNVAVLGTLKAGKFYVPLDINYPKDRINFILKSSGAKFLLCDSQTEMNASESHSISIFLVDDILADKCEPQIKPEIFSHSPAYLIYTSGSTGKPKGVVQSHRNILHNSMMQTNAYGITSKDRFSQLFSPGVMGAVRATYNAFLNGATLCPFDVKAEGFSLLRDWIVQTKLTILHMPSSLFRGFVGSTRDKKIYSGIRLVILGGEAANNLDFELYKQHFPNECIFCTGLGSTETCTVRMLLLDKYSTPEFRHGNLPLGYEVHGAQIRLFDDYGEEVKQGEVGEICVSSRFLALGYWNDEKKTWDEFEDDPVIPGNKRYLMGDLALCDSNGCLVHVGRKDFQVKIRGNRVEIKEVESAISSIAGILDVVVYPYKNIDGTNVLCACIVMEDKQVITESEIRRFLNQKIPNYMIPSVLGFLEVIPRTHTNKIDYQNLPSVDELISSYPSVGLNEGVNDHKNRAIRALIADCLENSSVITFTRNNLRDDYVNGIKDIKIDSLNLDSLSIMEFCIDLELKTNISITPEELLVIESLNELCKRLMEYKK